jgi:hypothetical protein
MSLDLARMIEELPPEQRREVQDFVEFLIQRRKPRGPRPNPYGLWQDLDADVPPDVIGEARREMWGSFPSKEV